MLSLLNIDYSSMISTLPLDSGSSDSLSNFINNGLVGLVTEADTTYKIAGSVIALILALIGCFFGYKLSRLFMGITGFIAGAIIGQIVASQILHVEGFASVLCIILCGAFIASLAFWIYRIGIFILCFALAFSAAGTLFPFEGDVQFFANVITGLIVGVLAVKYMRPVIILTSSIVCARGMPIFSHHASMFCATSAQSICCAGSSAMVWLNSLALPTALVFAGRVEKTSAHSP